MRRASKRKEWEYIDSNVSYWADPEEIKNSSTIKKIHISETKCTEAGLPIISDGYTSYVDAADTHSIIIGGTGSKKTRVFAMPMLHLFAQTGESFIATDPKGELYEKTSGFVKEQGYKTIVINFRDFTESDLWNPLQIPYELYHSGKVDEALAMINDLLAVISSPQRKTLKDVYFIDLGNAQALSYMLYFIETGTKEQVNVGNFTQFFGENFSPDQAKLMLETMTSGSIADINMKGVLTNENAKTTWGNCASTVTVMFKPFITQKSLCQMLSQSSFDMKSIGKEKTAIYIVVPDEKATNHFLVTLFIKQIYENLILEAQKIAGHKLPRRVNFLLDEFGNIPAIPDMSSMITAARSRNIKFYLMTQGRQQLRFKYYDEVDTIMGNCDNWVFLSSKEFDLLEYISSLCGYGVDKKPLITTTGLQRLRKEWDVSEALILYGRNYPFVSTLPDIDYYGYPKYPPVPRETQCLPKLVPYDVQTVISDIKAKRRPLAFSKEVHGKDLLFGDNAPTAKNDLFDW